MPHKPDHMVVGLGNPGAAYRRTRHNIGFMVLDLLAASFGINFRDGGRRSTLASASGEVETVPVVLAKPQTYMNRSGPPVVRLAKKHGISIEDIVVVHDDLDLAYGKLKIKEKGGPGGHKGIVSLIDAFGRDDFLRVRVGIGRSEAGVSVTDYVLGKFSYEEKASLDEILQRARDAVVSILCHGAGEAMNRFNR